MKKCLSVVCFLVFLSIYGHSQDFKIVGYMPAWRTDVAEIDYSKLTHLNYAFVLPSASGDIQSVPNPYVLEEMVEKGHEHGVKVLVAIGGWDLGVGGGNDEPFETLASKKSKRDRFVKSVMRMVDQYKLDGIDMDWEYPDAGESAMYFDTLMQELSVALHAKGKLLSAAVVAHGDHGAGILEGVFKSVDYINIMAYDGPAPHSSMEYANLALDYWRDRGLPREKTVLGVPFYGRDPFEGYDALVAADPQAPFKDEVNGIHYNGLKTMEMKTQLAMEKCAGIMVWDLSTDSPKPEASLLAVIYNTVHAKK